MSSGRGAIYKVLPDRSLQWNDVVIGALVTSVFFNIGKSLIGWYIDSSAVATSYGAAAGCAVTVGLLFGSDILVRC
jgi:membrane protein